MKKVLYGGHIASSPQGSSQCSSGRGCPYCNSQNGCAMCRAKGNKSGNRYNPKKKISGVRRIRSSDATTRSKISTGKYVSKCQQIKDAGICNRSQILNANNLPTTGQVTLQTCGYYEPDQTCYPITTPINQTKIINVDPSIPGLLGTIAALN